MPVPEILVVTQYYRPEFIGSGPFCADIAEWIAQNRRQVAVLTGFPHYPTPELFADGPVGHGKRETINGVAVERLRNWVPARATAPKRILSEIHFLAVGALAIAMRRARRQDLVLSLCPSILSVALGSIATRHVGKHAASVHSG